jgi:hypothetical protein
MSTWISWKTSKIFFLILLGLIFLSHLPFLEADPDRNMSVGRGPFTDEGLNTIQARNWVNHGDLDLKECDNLLKTPLLGLPLALTYKIFGSGHTVSRLHVLVLFFLALIIIGMDEKNRGVILFFFLVTLLQYQVFQSSHFSMAEMLSVASILLSLHFLSRSFDNDFSRKKKDIQALLAGMFLSLAYFFKIQFIYLIPLLPVSLVLLYFTSDYVTRRSVTRQGLVITSTLLFFLLLYLLAWYLPNKEAYDYMMAHQSGEFSFSGKIWEYIRFNLSYHFLKGWMQWFIYFFLLFLAGGFLMLKYSKSRRYPVFFFSSLAWFLLEMHKLMMVYLPTRYQVSLLASMGLMMSIVMSELFILPSNRKGKLIKAVALIAITVLLTFNVHSYFDTLRNRTYAIRDANEYLARSLAPEDLVLGAWAPSLTWKAGSKSLPVWNDFLNYQDPVNRFNPSVIIAETDEQDSEQAWASQGIDLQEISDSTKSFRIGHWDVRIYWLK